MFYRDYKSFYFDSAFIRKYIGFDFWRSKKIMETEYKLELGFFRFTFIKYRNK